MRALLAVCVLTASCGALVGTQTGEGGSDGTRSADGGSDAADRAPARTTNDDGGSDAATTDASADASFCARRTGDLFCEDFDQGHAVPLLLVGDGDAGVVADPSTTSAPNAFESTSRAADAIQITGFFLQPFDDMRSYAFDFDYRVTAPSSVMAGAFFAYVDFHVGGQRSMALEIRVDTSPAADMRWNDIANGVLGEQVTADITGAGPWYHLSFRLDANGATTSHGVAAPPRALTGDMYLELGLLQNPTGGSMTVRYDSATVR